MNINEDNKLDLLRIFNKLNPYELQQNIKKNWTDNKIVCKMKMRIKILKTLTILTKEKNITTAMFIFNYNITGMCSGSI